MNSQLLLPLSFVFLLLATSCNKDDGGMLLESPIETRPGTVMKGDSISIFGEESFSETAGFSVIVGGVPVEATSTTPTEIKIKIPESINFGQQEVTIVREGYRTATSLIFVSKYPVPTVSEIRPASGAIGTMVTIYGENLGADMNATKVAFSDAQGQPFYLSSEVSPVSPFTPLLSANSDSIQVKVPAGASPGPIHIWVLPNVDSDPDYILSVVSPVFTVSP